MRGLDYLVEPDYVLMLEVAMRADLCLEHFHVAASELFKVYHLYCVSHVGAKDLNALVDVAAEALAQLVAAIVFVLSYPHLGLFQASGCGADCLLAC